MHPNLLNLYRSPKMISVDRNFPGVLGTFEIHHLHSFHTLCVGAKML